MGHEGEDLAVTQLALLAGSQQRRLGRLGVGAGAEPQLAARPGLGQHFDRRPVAQVCRFREVRGCLLLIFAQAAATQLGVCQAAVTLGIAHRRGIAVALRRLVDEVDTVGTVGDEGQQRSRGRVASLGSRAQRCHRVHHVTAVLGLLATQTVVCDSMPRHQRSVGLRR